MFKKLIWIIDGLEVRPEKMLENLRLTQGCIFSEDVKNLMCSYGIDPEVVYYLLRDSAFEALEKKKPYFDVILERGSEHFTAPDRVEALRSCFDEDQCLEYVGEIFARFGL